MLYHNKILVVLGPPGTGKTFTTHEMIDEVLQVHGPRMCAS